MIDDKMKVPRVAGATYMVDGSTFYILIRCGKREMTLCAIGADGNRWSEPVTVADYGLITDDEWDEITDDVETIEMVCHNELKDFLELWWEKKCTSI